jgi:excisionase family DNA binding protein
VSPTPERRYVSLAKAAVYADCNERTLRRHIATGELTGYRLGRVIRIYLNELDAWLAPIPTVKAG